MDRTSAIRNRLQKATPGEWKYGIREDESIWMAFGDLESDYIQFDFNGLKSDAELIASSPADIEFLLKENERLQKQVEQMKCCENCMHQPAQYEPSCEDCDELYLEWELKNR